MGNVRRFVRDIAKKTAASIASFLLSKVNVQAEFQKRFQQKRESVGLTKENVLREIARLSFSRCAQAAIRPEVVNSLPTQELDDHTAACIAGRRGVRGIPRVKA
jgi:hypothetical protein